MRKTHWLAIDVIIVLIVLFLSHHTLTQLIHLDNSFFDSVGPITIALEVSCMWIFFTKLLK